MDLFLNPQARIVIAKTTHIGDVVITLPLAGVLKKYYPKCHIVFLAKGASCEIARQYCFVDEVLDYNALIEKHGDLAAGLKSLNADIFIQGNTSKLLAHAAKSANIPCRIGNAYRLFNWPTCSEKVFISRESKCYNKRQLDLEYLWPLGFKDMFSYHDLAYLYQFKAVENHYFLQNPSKKFKVVLHPTLITALTHQWPLTYFQEVINALDTEKFDIYITGISSDRLYLEDFLKVNQGRVVDLVGHLNMQEFIGFLQQADGLIAASTGPLHLAAALGIHALGLYRSNHEYIRRWEAIGFKSELIASSKACRQGRAQKLKTCACIKNIRPEYVVARIRDWQQQER